MSSFYEKIMELPLFKGASHEMIHYFFEKTPISFLNYEKDGVIISEGEKCDSVICLISGKISLENSFYNSELTVKRRLASETILGAEYLFGLETSYPFEVTASEKCSVIEFSKSKYISQLQNNKLFLINYLNYLSKRAQKSSVSFKSGNLTSDFERFRNFIELTTERRSFDIKITSTSGLTNIFGKNGNFQDDLIRYEEKGIIIRTNDSSLLIPDRQQFLDLDRIQ